MTGGAESVSTVGGLPPADPLLVAETAGALPVRLRAKLDAAVAAAGSWVRDGALVRLPGGAEVRLEPGADGVLRHPDHVICGCLLAPACLHRAAVLAAAPIAEDEPAEPASVGEAAPIVLDLGTADDPVGGPSAVPELGPDAMAAVGPGNGVPGNGVPGNGVPGSGVPGTRVPAGGVPTGEVGLDGEGGTGDGWSAAERDVAAAVGAAAARLLEAGLAGAGAAEQGELLVGIHRARRYGLHRLAASTTRVVTGVRAARRDDASFSLPGLTADLLDVLEVSHSVTAGLPDPASWRGRARTAYSAVGGLRLSGLCLEPVLSGSGYAGVVVWVIDAGGRIWSVSDVKPGGAERIPMAAQATVALGEAGVSHRRLSRGGLVLSGATANPDGRLGAGAKVRAVSAAGTAWTSPPLRQRFGRLADAVAAGPGEAEAGRGDGRPSSLLLLDLTVCGSQDDAVLAVDADGAGVRLTSAALTRSPSAGPPATGSPSAAPARSFSPGAPAAGAPAIGSRGSAWGTTVRDNLRILGAAPGLRLLVVGRFADRAPGGTARDGASLVEVLAVGGDDLRLPESFGGHADLGIDRLSAAFVHPSGSCPGFPEARPTLDPLTALGRRLRRVVSGGRRTLSVPGVPVAVRAEVAALRRAGLATGADLLELLLAGGQPGERDVFGRLVLDDPAALSRAWLAAGVYSREATIASSPGGRRLT